MTVAVIATVVVADFPVHPSRQPIVIVLAVVAARNFIFGHDLPSIFCAAAKSGAETIRAVAPDLPEWRAVNVKLPTSALGVFANLVMCASC